jgi:hypothetical protein
MIKIIKYKNIIVNNYNSVNNCAKIINFIKLYQKIIKFQNFKIKLYI